MLAAIQSSGFGAILCQAAARHVWHGEPYVSGREDAMSREVSQHVQNLYPEGFGALSVVDGFPIPNETSSLLLKATHTADRGIGPYDISPYTVDGVDLIHILVSGDADLVTLDNDDGPGTSTAFEAWRLMSIWDSGMGWTTDDASMAKAVCKHHWVQCVKRLGQHNIADVEPINRLLVARLTKGTLFDSDRIRSRTELARNFLEYTYAWRTHDSIHIHLGRGGKAAPLSDYRERLYRDPETQDYARAFYAEHEKFDGDGRRKINGRQEKYKSLIFPLDQTIASDLIWLLEQQPKAKVIIQTALREFVNQEYTPSTPETPDPTWPKPR